MAALSDYTENAFYNHLLRNTAFTSPTSVWLAAFTANTGLETNAPTAEVTGGSYARLELVGATGRTFAAPTAGSGSNAQAWQFVQATANWGVITHLAAMSALTAGNVLAHTQLNSSVTINSGNILTFQVGQIIFNFA